MQEPDSESDLLSPTVLGSSARYCMRRHRLVGWRSVHFRFITLSRVQEKCRGVNGTRAVVVAVVRLSTVL